MLENILAQFELPQDEYEINPYGNGHINSTFTAQGKRRRYIVQKINRAVFPDVRALMRNIGAVCRYIFDYTKESGGDTGKCLMPVKAVTGEDFAEHDGEFWRVYNFIENTVTVDMPLSAEHFGEGGGCFARFAKILSGFPADSLTDVLPGFHDTPMRLAALGRAAEKDAFGRLRLSEELYEFALRREKAADIIKKGTAAGDIPVRVTHNDTKFNNLLLDAVTKKPVAVIDLDTVMKGSALYDFGDAIRTGCNSAPEDERDTDKVAFRKDYYDAFERAYDEVTAGEFTEAEQKLKGFSAMLMTYECGVRFLTDYLEGDVYFRTHYDKQNYYRARTQFALVDRMEKFFGKMEDYAR